MNSTVWIVLAVAFAAVGSPQPGGKIAGAVTVTRECGGRGARPARGAPPRPKIDDVAVTLDPETFDAYLKPEGGGLVFHFYQVRNNVRGEEIPFTITAPSTNSNPTFDLGQKWAALRAETLAYELVITDLKGTRKSKAYSFKMTTCIPIPLIAAATLAPKVAGWFPIRSLYRKIV